jgi:hypothetical protein
MSDDPMKPLVALTERVVAKLAEVGMTVENVAILPNPGGPHTAQILVQFDGSTLPEDDAPTDVEEDEDPEARKAFDDMMREQARFEAEEEARQARESLKDFLD